MPQPGVFAFCLKKNKNNAFPELPLLGFCDGSVVADRSLATVNSGLAKPMASATVRSTEPHERPEWTVPKRQRSLEDCVNEIPKEA